MPFLARLLGRSKSKEVKKTMRNNTTLDTNDNNGSKGNVKKDNELYVYKREIISTSMKCPACKNPLVKETYVVEGPYFSKNGHQISALIKVFVNYKCDKCGCNGSKRAIYIPLYGVEVLSPFFTDEFKKVIEQIRGKADEYTSILKKVLI